MAVKTGWLLDAGEAVSDSRLFHHNFYRPELIISITIVMKTGKATIEKRLMENY